MPRMQSTCMPRIAHTVLTVRTAPTVLITAVQAAIARLAITARRLPVLAVRQRQARHTAVPVVLLDLRRLIRFMGLQARPTTQARPELDLAKRRKTIWSCVCKRR